MNEGTSAKLAGERPPCDCHGLPMRWNKRGDLIAGGYWRCGQLYKDTQKAWRDANRERRAEYMRLWREAHPRDRQSYMRRYRYGLEETDYQTLIARQQGLCAICDQPEVRSRKGTLHVDHDHATGRVRGLICGQCNTALERVERKGWADRAAAYLAAF